MLKAAEKGNADGMYMLGVVHELGRGVEQSDTLAADWYKKAALTGDAKVLTTLKQRAPESEPVAEALEPPRDCVLGTWSQWQPCSVACGGPRDTHGSQKRRRHTSTHPNRWGKQCGKMVQYVTWQYVTWRAHGAAQCQDGVWVVFLISFGSPTYRGPYYGVLRRITVLVVRAAQTNPSWPPSA